jgi:hypothetical protein
MSAGLRLVDKFKFVKAFTAQVPSTSTSLWVDLEFANHVAFVISVSNTSGSITGSAITFNAATAIAGTNPVALPFVTYFYDLASQAGDGFTLGTAVSNTFTTTTTASAQAVYIVEFNAADLVLLGTLGTTQGTYTCIQVALATGVLCTIDVLAIVSDLRYGGNFVQNPSALI